MESKEDIENFGNISADPPTSMLDKQFSEGAKPEDKYYQESEKWKQALDIENTNTQLSGVISDLDVKLNRVLAKQEYEYLKGYNIYVKKKEKELRELIDTLNKKNSTTNTKDQKIIELNTTIQRIRNDQMNLEKMKEKQRKETLKWKSKAENFEEDCKFLQKQLKETKKQNQLLKLAITRLQYELENKAEKDGNTFMTDVAQDGTEMKPDDILEMLKSEHLDANQLSILEKSNLLNTSDSQSLIKQDDQGAMKSIISNWGDNKSKSVTRRPSKSPISHYRFIPTQNIKYEAYLDTLFDSNYNDKRKKKELILYMQSVETRFNNVCKGMRAKLDIEKRKI